MKKILLMICLLGITSIGNAQILKPVKWSYAVKKLNVSEVMIYMKAVMESGWHIYGDSKKAGAPSKTSFTFKPSADYKLVGPVITSKSTVKYEAVIGMSVAFFEREATFLQKISLKNPNTKSISVLIEYMTCNNEKCLPPEELNLTIPLDN